MKELWLLSLGYGVVHIAGAPRVAAQNALDAHISTLDGAPFFNGLNGIVGAGGIVPAFVVAQQRR